MNYRVSEFSEKCIDWRKNGLLESLDRYEGCRDRDVKSRLFRRETAWAKLTKGSVFVWVYIFTGRVNGRSLISTGRYELR